MQNLVKTVKNQESIGDMLRYWRQLRRKSQMELALDVDISSRHLSFVETGKSRPSHHLVSKLAQALQMPFRHRNAFLIAAGYAPEFEEEPFDGPGMEVVREALRRMLKQHAPYPAFVVNTGYRILMTNAGYDRMIAFYAGDKALGKYDNAIRILFAEDGLRPFVKGWPTIEQFLLARLWEEVVSTQNKELMMLYRDIEQLKSSDGSMAMEIDSSLPVMSLTLEKGGRAARFFTTITTLGTPLDLTTQELRIELLFPSDEATKKMFPLEA